MSIKTALKQGACAVAFGALAGCAIVPYNDGGYGYAPVVAPVRAAPVYSAPVYVAPFPLWGFSYYNYSGPRNFSPAPHYNPPPYRHFSPALPPRFPHGGHGFRR